jgi:enolase
MNVTEKIVGSEVLDPRGNPTVEAVVVLSDGRW